MFPDQIPHQREICSVKEIAEYLGVSESKIRQLVRRNAIPYAKIDGQYKFYVPTIREWVREMMVPVAVEEVPEYAPTIANRIWDSSIGI
jgi:excisionase family DNA binding protein